MKLASILLTIPVALSCDSLPCIGQRLGTVLDVTVGDGLGILWAKARDALQNETVHGAAL